MANNGAALAIVLLLVVALFAVFYVRESAVNSNVPFSCPVNEFLHELNPGACSQVRYDQLAQTPFNASKGLVGYWSLNEGQGLTAYDYSGDGYSMTFTQKTGSLFPSWETGKFGGGVGFNRTDQVYLQGPVVTSPKYITASAWIQPNGTAYDVMSQYGGAGSRAWGLLINDPSSGDLALYISVDGSTLQYIYANAGIGVGDWSFIAGTYDGTTLSIYANGTLIKSAAVTTTGPLYQGSAIGITIGDLPNYAHFFSGNIDDVRIYGSADSASQIAQLYSYVPAV